MTLKEIYNRYGLGDIFAKEIIKRYKKDRRNYPNNNARLDFKELKQIFNSELIAVDYLLNLLHIDFLKLARLMDSISREVCEKYLSYDYDWLDNYDLVEEVDSEFLLKTLLIDEQIINYSYVDLRNLLKNISSDDINKFILNNNIDYDIVLFFWSKSINEYEISNELFNKYLTNNYSWLNEYNLVEKINPLKLLEILLIDKQIINYPHIDLSKLLMKVLSSDINDFILNNNIEADIVLLFLGREDIAGYKILGDMWGYKVAGEIFNRYLVKDYRWLNNKDILNKIDDNDLIKYFMEHQDIIINNYENKKAFFNINDIITVKIIEVSLLKKEYDNIIELIKNDESLAWLIPEKLNNEEEKRKVLIICKEYSSLKYNKNNFKVYVNKNYEQINEKNIKYIIKLINRVSLSNSSELRRVSDEVIKALINASNAFGKLERIENLFLKNNIPFVGKAYAVFDILYPDKTKVGQEMLSPVLQNWQGFYREVIIFADLIKASFGSNNRSIRDYLQNIEKGNTLFNKISKGEVSYENLCNEEKIVIDTFCNHLITLYERTKKGKKEELDFHKNPVETLQILKEKFSTDGHVDYDLPNRIVKMFCHFAGINTLKDAKAYMEMKVKKADARNRQRGMQPLEFKEGDFVKGIGEITYLRTILQNGSVAREFLGGNADSDATPLDTDVCRLANDQNIGDAIAKTPAIDYGPIYFVLKNDSRFVLTRDRKGNTYQGSPNKLEVFYTGYLGDTHYGIRTGFASSEIDYIVVQDYDERLGLEIAINGFYIPVSDFNGKIVFTPKDYDNLRGKMQGLSYLGSNNYQVSPYLNNEGTKEMLTIKQVLAPTENKKLSKITKIIKEAVEKCHLELKLGYDGNLEEGKVELLNTGSTARQTNLPRNADYDYILRIDTTIMKDKDNLAKFLNNLKQYIQAEQVIIDANKIRFLKVDLGDGERADIDLSYMAKLDKLEYSTEVALEERLKTIKKINAQSYDYTLANILLAKKVLKENGVYKPYHSPECQNNLGGLGGVGIENWILQNNGSFFEALNSFLQVAQDKDFKKFCQEYFIWDFGENHYALKANDLDSYSYRYPHDDFVAQNMNEAGYNQMKKVLASCQRQYVTYLLNNLDHNYLSNNITKDVYIASLEKLKNDVGNLALQREIAKHLDQVCQDTGKHY